MTKSKPSLEKMIDYLENKWKSDFPIYRNYTKEKDDAVLRPVIESANFCIAWKGRKGSLKDLLFETYTICKRKNESKVK